MLIGAPSRERCLRGFHRIDEVFPLRAKVGKTGEEFHASSAGEAQLTDLVTRGFVHIPQYGVKKGVGERTFPLALAWVSLT